MTVSFISPCCRSDFDHVSKGPAHVTCKCHECGGLFSAVDAIEVGSRRLR